MRDSHLVGGRRSEVRKWKSKAKVLSMLEGEPLASGWFRDSVTVTGYRLESLDLASKFTINDRHATTKGHVSRGT
jgi:hypothetical protein